MGRFAQGAWNQRILEGLTLVVTLGAIVYAVLVGVDVLGSDEVRTPVRIAGDVVSDGGTLAPGYEMDTVGGNLVVTDPTVWERVALAGPPILGALTVSTSLSVLKNDRVRAVRFSTLVALCDALDCQPGALFSVT